VHRTRGSLVVYLYGLEGNVLCDLFMLEYLYKEHV